MADFDADDKNSWYFGSVSREETNTILQSERDSGVFFVRDSTTIKGDFVLCVKEDNKISHYIINKIQTGGVTRFRIGEQEFSSLPALLNFYKTHYLDTTSLIRPPANRPKFITKYRFEGRDPDDLPFEKGEILTLVRKDEDQWWTVRNERDQIGLVPVPYIERYQPLQQYNGDTRTPMPSGPQSPPTSLPQPNGPLVIQMSKALPAWARSVKRRDPNVYDKRQLGFPEGEEILVTAMNVNGHWEGQLRDGTTGLFPFTYVKWIDDADEQE